MTYEEEWTLAIARAKERSRAYYRGLDAGIDGSENPAREYTEPLLQTRCSQGYGDGVAWRKALAFRKPVTNPARDNG